MVKVKFFDYSSLYESIKIQTIALPSQKILADLFLTLADKYHIREVILDEEMSMDLRAAINRLKFQFELTVKK